eukprot:3600442-Pleurochrysis_carterae.AAC.1
MCPRRACGNGESPSAASDSHAECDADRDAAAVQQRQLPCRDDVGPRSESEDASALAPAATSSSARRNSQRAIPSSRVCLSTPPSTNSARSEATHAAAWPYRGVGANLLAPAALPPGFDKSTSRHTHRSNPALDLLGLWTIVPVAFNSQGVVAEMLVSLRNNEGFEELSLLNLSCKCSLGGCSSPHVVTCAVACSRSRSQRSLREQYAPQVPPNTSIPASVQTAVCCARASGCMELDT